jgi:hypothetical protein
MVGSSTPVPCLFDWWGPTQPMKSPRYHRREEGVSRRLSRVRFLVFRLYDVVDGGFDGVEWGWGQGWWEYSPVRTYSVDEW